MWEFDEQGDLYFEKAVAFVKELLDRWQQAKANHHVTVVFFSRTYFEGGVNPLSDETTSPPGVMEDAYAGATRITTWHVVVLLLFLLIVDCLLLLGVFLEIAKFCGCAFYIHRLAAFC